MKKYLFLLSLIILGCLRFSNAMEPNEYGVACEEMLIYKNNIIRSFDKPIYALHKGDCFSLLKLSGEMALISYKDGREGWVHQSNFKECRSLGEVNDKPFSMDELKVVGYLQYPQAIYIYGVMDSADIALKVDKSFTKNEYYFYNFTKEEFEIENEFVYKNNKK